MSDQSVTFDRETGRRFIRVVKDFFTSEVRWRARGLFALLIAFALTISGLNVVNSYVGRDFMTAISHRDQMGFVWQAILYIGVFAASTAVAVLYRFTEERLGLFWRVWLTRRITRLKHVVEVKQKNALRHVSDRPPSPRCLFLDEGGRRGDGIPLEE
jgi:putative ATP-binding cassette transporter